MGSRKKQCCGSMSGNQRNPFRWGSERNSKESWTLDLILFYRLPSASWFHRINEILPRKLFRIIMMFSSNPGVWTRVVHWQCVSLWELRATDPASDVTPRVSSVARLWSRLILSLWPVVSISRSGLSTVSVTTVTPVSCDDLDPGDPHSTSQVYGNFWVALS